MTSIDRYLVKLFRTQHGLVRRQQVLRLGITPRQIQYRLSCGEWQLVHPSVYRLAAWPATFEQRLLAACWATGPQSVASHASAAWLWGLLPQPPDHPTITVPPNQHPRPAGVEIHRLDIDPAHISFRSGIPCTNPGPDDRYRLDYMLLPPVAMEVDGYAHHWSPEAKAADEARRNQLRLGGLFLLVYTWVDLRAEQRRMYQEITTALSRLSRPGSWPPRPGPGRPPPLTAGPARVRRHGGPCPPPATP
jgi:hypothetical protein